MWLQWRSCACVGEMSRFMELVLALSPQPRTGFSARASACRCSRSRSLADLASAGDPSLFFVSCSRAKVLRMARAPGVGAVWKNSITILTCLTKQKLIKWFNEMWVAFVNFLSKIIIVLRRDAPDTYFSRYRISGVAGNPMWQDYRYLAIPYSLYQ